MKDNENQISVTQNDLGTSNNMIFEIPTDNTQINADNVIQDF